jgi:hypothetical protein
VEESPLKTKGGHHYGKTLAGLAGVRCFDGGVEGQRVPTE